MIVQIISKFESSLWEINDPLDSAKKGSWKLIKWLLRDEMAIKMLIGLDTNASAMKHFSLCYLNRELLIPRQIRAEIH